MAIKLVIFSGILCCVYGAIQDDVKFFLLTRENPLVRQELIFQNSSTIMSSNFQPTRPTRVLIHGFIEDSNYGFPFFVATSYLIASNVNVILVDYRKIAQENYWSARNSSRYVGEHIAVFLDYLNTTTGMTFESLYLIGYSIGAHIAGYAGKNVHNGQIEAIHGLDPASLYFDYDEPNDRLASTDAKYVQVYHTAACSLGYGRPIGHVDIYPNYGMSQPSCNSLHIRCSHEASHRFFGLSLLEPTRYLATQCMSSFSLVFFRTCSATGITTYVNDTPKPSTLHGIYYFLSND